MTSFPAFDDQTLDAADTLMTVEEPVMTVFFNPWTFYQCKNTW